MSDKKKSKGAFEKSALIPVGNKPLVPAPLGEELPGTTDAVQIYMNEVKKYPLLSREEEDALAKHYFANQDPDAAKKLVTANLRLVVKIALEYKRAFHNLLDLIQEGNLGLMKAVTKYDPAKGTKFSYYASWWIRAYILKYIIDNFKLVKIGTTQAQKKLFYNLIKEKERIEAQGIQADAHLISKSLDVKPAEVVEMQQRLSGSDISLDSTTKDGEHTLDFLAQEPATAEEQVTQDQLKNQLFKYLDEFVDQLNEKEKTIFRDRIYAEIPVTLQEIADKYGITRERIRQIESRAIHKLKNFFQKKGFEVAARPKL